MLVALLVSELSVAVVQYLFCVRFVIAVCWLSACLMYVCAFVLCVCYVIIVDLLGIAVWLCVCCAHVFVVCLLCACCVFVMC